MIFVKKNNNLNNSFYPELEEETNARASKQSSITKKIIPIVAIILVLIIVLILTLNLLGQKNNFLFFGPDGNLLASNVTISKNGELIDSLSTDGNILQLSGNFKDRRDCHIEPDWLLIYKKEGSNIIFERTGTHSDLFH